MTLTATAVDLIGQPVIVWTSESIYTYQGTNRDGGEQFIYGGGRAGIETDPARVAPADTPIPAADPRVTVTKGTKAAAMFAGYYLSGSGAWALSVGDYRTTWHSTKKEATAAGLRRCAIIDFHAANDTQEA